MPAVLGRRPVAERGVERDVGAAPGSGGTRQIRARDVVLPLFDASYQRTFFTLSRTAWRSASRSEGTNDRWRG